MQHCGSGLQGGPLALKAGLLPQAARVAVAIASIKGIVQTLDTEKSDLERSVAELKMKCEAIEARENERRAAEDKKHADEVAYLKKYTDQLKMQLDSYLSTGKKGAAAAAAASATPPATVEAKAAA